MTTDKVILKHALLNAKDFGQARESSVLGKVIAEKPELKKDMKALMKQIGEAVKKVNGMKPEERERELKKFGKIEKPEQAQREGLPPLPGAINGKVVTRFAPEPNGYMHLGHLKASLLSFLYAKMYKGKMFLRFEDTNPKKERKEYYEAIRADLKTFGIKYDKEVIESDHMELFYKKAEELIRSNILYVCTCPQETVAKLREMGRGCDCRDQDADNNLVLWKQMLESGKEGESMVRMKTDAADPNPALRDPSMLRVVDAVHPLQGKKYRVYPLYDFACTIMDHELGVTHVLRDKGFENDAVIQGMLYNHFGWKQPINIQFGRMKSVAGIPMSKRKIRIMIDEGKLTGFDDLRIPTPRNLMKRGFRPEAIKRLIEEIGPSKNDITVQMDAFESYNRQIIDKDSNRYFFVAEPVEITLSKIPAKSIKAPLYPGKRRFRKIPVTKKVFIDKTDFVANRGKEARLMHMANFIIDKKAAYTGMPNKDIPKIHWVPAKNVKVRLMMPDGRVLNGVAEPDVKNVKPDQTVQFERIGFARCDSKGIYYFAHK